jgi:hypothetical protein
LPACLLSIDILRFDFTILNAQLLLSMYLIFTFPYL